MSASATDEIVYTSLALQDMNKFYFKSRTEIFTECTWIFYAFENSYLLNFLPFSEWLR